MNTLVHLWPGTNHLSDVAILDTPCYPARYYFGPVREEGSYGAWTPPNPGEWVPLDNATSRFHPTLKQAIAAADLHGLDIADVTFKAVTAHVAERGELEVVVQRLAALRTDAGLSEAIAYLPELASLVDHAEAVLKGAPFEASGYGGGG